MFYVYHGSLQSLISTIYAGSRGEILELYYQFLSSSSTTAVEMSVKRGLAILWMISGIFIVSEALVST
jgi:hypothetical protein